MAAVKNSVYDKTAFLTVPDKFWVTFGHWVPCLRTQFASVAGRCL